MATVTKPIALDESLNTTELSSRNVADVLAQELQAVVGAIGGIAIPSADHVSYDNSGSGLSATDVQNALDEIVSDIPTVNDGVLTIQQNGTSIGSFSANTASNVTANIKTPTADEKTATDEFTTADGGLLSKCMIDLVPVQSGSGDPSPDNVRAISGHTEAQLQVNGKNLLEIKNYSRTHNDVAYTVNPDGSVKAYGTPSGISYFTLTNNQNNLSPSNTTPFKAGDTIIVSTGGSKTLNARLSNGTYDTLADSTPITLTQDIAVIYVQYNGSAVNETIYPMIRKVGSTSDFEPYLGHLYQVQIGSTVYGGYDEIVSGNGKSAYGIADFGNLTWYYDSANTRFRGEMPSDYKQPTGASDRYQYLYCSCYKPDDSPVTGSHVNNTIGGFQGTSYVWVNDSAYTDAGQFKTARTGQKIAYLLSTPTDITHDSTQIETLAGQNNLSTPLSGQSIETNGVEYKELFTFADVKEYVKPLIPYSNAGSHNAIYRGKYLGSSVTADQWSAIQNGTFDDLFIGDYWIINGVTWRIAHFDYWLGTGDTECTDHHVAIVPDTRLYTAKMNSTDTTTGGYYNSEMRGGANYLVSGSSNLYNAKVTIDNAFGSSHILSHRELLTNAVSSGVASSYAWRDSSVDLMSEVMVYGSLAWSIDGKGYETAVDKEQFALFKFDMPKATTRNNWWLRGVGSSTTFADVSNYGIVSTATASANLGVRPCFAIK